MRVYKAKAKQYLMAGREQLVLNKRVSNNLPASPIFKAIKASLGIIVDRLRTMKTGHTKHQTATKVEI